MMTVVGGNHCRCVCVWGGWGGGRVCEVCAGGLTEQSGRDKPSEAKLGGHFEDPSKRPKR